MSDLGRLTNRCLAAEALAESRKIQLEAIRSLARYHLDPKIGSASWHMAEQVLGILNGGAS